MPVRSTLLTGGPIRTLEPAGVVEALAYAGRTIVAAGRLDAVRAAAPDAVTVDLGGRAVVPGFVDPHHHLSISLLFELGVDVHPEAAPTLAALYGAVRAASRSLGPDEWVVGIGYDEWHVAERRAPARERLDEAGGGRPVFLMQYSGHEACASSRALELVGVDRHTPDPPGGVVERDRRGRPTGRLVENAMRPVEALARVAMVARHGEGFAARLPDYERRLFSVGITRLGDPIVPPDLLALYRRARERGALTIPCVVGPLAPGCQISTPDDWLDHGATGEGDDALRIGPAKLVLDGGERCFMCLSLAQAAGMAARSLAATWRRRSLAPLRAMTRTSPVLAHGKVQNGIAFYPDERGLALARAAVDRGMSLAIHAIGSTAVEQALAIHAAVRARHADRPPPRVEHALFTTPEARARMAELGVMAVVQPDLLSLASDGTLPPVPSGLRFMALRSLLDAGVRVAASSDYPASRIDPLVGLREAVRRRTARGEVVHADEAVSPEEVLAMCTREAARALGCLDVTGTLAPGKRADLVVLSRDPCAPGADLDEAGVERTVLGGETVWEAGSA
jgi:hypothetical protein